VIGGGIAGTAAALASARRGARVTLVRAAPGATALCMGGWHGAMPSELAAEFDAAGHAWMRAAHKLPAPDGTLRSFDFAAQAQAAARLTGTTLVCGFTGLTGFRADVLAQLWGDALSCAPRSCAITLRDTPAAGWSPASLAGRIERECDDVATQLGQRAREHGAETIVLPAVLGFDRVAEVRAALEHSTGVTIAETLGAAPSLPGWRLQTALDRMLARASVTIEAGRVVDRRARGTELQAVTVRQDGAQRELTAATFVLATGKFIGGGIEAHGEFHEPALGCPLWIDHLGERFEANEPLTLTNADRRAEQPLLSVGVATDGKGKPVSPGGEPFYDNVWVAGAVRAEHTVGVHGLGAAAQDGWHAGEQAAQ
jgi:glycerol-3-phosphate dehydrogenase subunit B